MLVKGLNTQQAFDEFLDFGSGQPFSSGTAHKRSSEESVAALKTGSVAFFWPPPNGGDFASPSAASPSDSLPLGDTRKHPQHLRSNRCSGDALQERADLPAGFDDLEGLSGP